MSLLKTTLQLTKRDKDGVLGKLHAGTYNIQVEVDEMGTIVKSDYDILVSTSVYQSLKLDKE